MRIKELFTVPEGAKVTEKMFCKVLLSSICGILLSMACLAGTTWAWFTVSIENRGNEIQIATVTADVSIQDEGMNAVDEDASGKYIFQPGTYTAHIKLENNATESKSPVYVVISVSCDTEQKYYYLTFENGSKEATQTFRVETVSGTVSFSVSWAKPASTDTVSGEAIVIGQISDESVTEHTTEPLTESDTETTTPPTTEASLLPTATDETSSATATGGGTTETADAFAETTDAASIEETTAPAAETESVA